MREHSEKRVVITGVGVVSPIGNGANAFWSGLSTGASGIDKVTRFDMAPFKAKMAAEVKDCEWGKLLGRKECWSGSRSVSFTLVAAKFALEHAGIEVTPDNQSGIGVSLGTTLACLNLMAQLDRQALRDGPRTSDPMLFPDTGVSAPACRISIFFGVQAFNATLSNGATSALDAVHYGAELIRSGSAHTVLAGGLEELCRESFTGAYVQGFLSSARDGQEEACRPFDQRRNGTILGEGSALFVLEDYEHARARGATVWSEVRGYGAAFDARAVLDAGRGDAACRAMRNALKDAALTPDSVDLIACSANSSPAGDLAESNAIRCIFGKQPKPLLTAMKSMLGESYSAAGAMQVAGCTLAMGHGLVPPTINCDEPDPLCAADRIVREPTRLKLQAAMVNSVGYTGNAASLVLTAPN